MDYRDISSYSDEHVAEKIQELEADDNFHKYIANLIFPVANRFFSKFTKVAYFFFCTAPLGISTFVPLQLSHRSKLKISTIESRPIFQNEQSFFKNVAFCRTVSQQYLQLLHPMLMKCCWNFANIQYFQMMKK